jgi:hypothetical protein
MFSNTPSELEFKRRIERLGKSVTHSTKEENITKHIDFFVDGVSFDVKGSKKLNRSDSFTSNTMVWLELRNVKGDKGWLCSDVQKIAFLLGDFFYVFDRQALLEFIRKFVGHGKIYRFKKYKELFTRPGRKDLITYVYLDDIIHLLEYKI